MPLPAKFSRALTLLIAAAMSVVIPAVAAPAAQASSVVYVDGGEVWQSQLDGTRKRRLSTGEGDWTEVAAADNGNVVGIRRAPNTQGTYSFFHVWNASGTRIAMGPLPYKGTGTLNVMPLGIDLNASGDVMAYGYSFSGSNWLSRGTWATPITNSAGADPIDASGGNWPTFAGSRLVVAGAAFDSNQVFVQTAAAAPWGDDFVQWLDLSQTSLTNSRTDVAANGTIAGIEVNDGTNDKIAAIGLPNGLGGSLSGTSTDCFLPTAGNAKSVTFSQDGNAVAWIDAQGLKVAGRPLGTADICTLASPAVALAPGAVYASISGADVPTSGGGGGGGGGGTIVVPPGGAPLNATPGNDIIQGTPGNDVIYGNGGNDTIYGNGGNDVIIGGPGNDKLKGGGGKDKCIGGPGKDVAKKCEKVKSVP